MLIIGANVSVSFCDLLGVTVAWLSACSVEFRLVCLRAMLVVRKRQDGPLRPGPNLRSLPSSPRESLFALAKRLCVSSRVRCSAKASLSALLIQLLWVVGFF